MPWRLNPFTGEIYYDEASVVPPGGGGLGGVSVYLHTQSSPSSTWTINHNLGTRPSTELFNSSNEEIEGSVSNPTVNQTVVTFETAVSGFARLIGDAPVGSPPVSYVHTQSTPSTTWTINHNLGFVPSTELFSSGGEEIDGEVTHTSNNQTVVTFVTAVSGLARLN